MLRSVAAETGATVNQVVLAGLMGGEIPVIPLVGASSVAQLEESLGAVDLELTAALRPEAVVATATGGALTHLPGMSLISVEDCSCVEDQGDQSSPDAPQKKDPPRCCNGCRVM